MNKIAGLITVLLIAFSSSQTAAHKLWVNLHESYTHSPGHVLTSLGWGHAVPLDDLLASSIGTFQLASYDLIDPSGNKTGLGLPEGKRQEAVDAQAGMKIQPGDLGIRKLSLGKETKPGTWQVAAVSKESFFTQYIDKKDRQRMTPKPMDQITNAKQILASVKYKTFAKSFTAVKEWTPPKPLGHELELMPLTNLADVQVGDLVRFDVSFMGKPLTFTADTIEYMTATSNSFGGPDKFSLYSRLVNGKAQFRMPAAGQWVVNVYVRQEVTPDGPLKELSGKCTTVFHSGTISFTVKP